MSQIENAVQYAVFAHAGMKRKGKERPYILHPLEVLSIVGTMTEDEDVLAAAVLHDTVEDTSVTSEDIRRVFGARVAELVSSESENKRKNQSAESTWELRKQETIDHLQSADRDMKLICLGDKLSNLREMGYIAFARSFYGKKIIRIRDVDKDITVGATGSGYTDWYRYPASFLIPEDDPQFNKEGSTALGEYGYMLNSRCWSYDVGLALLVFATSGDYDICLEMLHRMKEDQNEDGSWNFSYDIYIGKLFHDYVRTGAIGWIVWGACYAILQMGTFGDESWGFRRMLQKAGTWLINHQVTDPNDPRYGLLRGGYGMYNNAYDYTADDIEWCAVEHQCSALQALEGLSLVLKNKRYKECAELIRDQLYLRCYDKENKRFFQGINGGVPDQSWALDCTTWAGMLIFSVLHSSTAKDCLATAKEAFLVEGKPLVQSVVKEYYNQRYYSNETYDGFMPYSNKTPDYDGAPEIIWTEGTLGYAALALMLGQPEEARKYVDECIKLQNAGGSSGGVLYVNATYGMMPWEFHTWESVVSSAWLYLIIHNPDVLFPRTLRQVYFMARITAIKDRMP